MSFKKNEFGSAGGFMVPEVAFLLVDGVSRFNPAARRPATPVRSHSRTICRGNPGQSTETGIGSGALEALKNSI